MRQSIAIALSLFVGALFANPGWGMCEVIASGHGPAGEPDLTPNLTKLNARPTLSVPTLRLNMRTPRAGDLVPLLPIFRRRLTVQYTWFAFDEGVERWNPTTLRERFEWQAEEELAGRRHDFVIELNDKSHTVIGRCALYEQELFGDMEFGITISHEYWGRGYGEEATRAMIDFAFREMNTPNVYLEVLPQNKGMQEICRTKLGLKLKKSAAEAAPSGPFKLKYDYYVAARP